MLWRRRRGLKNFLSKVSFKNNNAEMKGKGLIGLKVFRKLRIEKVSRPSDNESFIKFKHATMLSHCYDL
jgi:hypothetical protein